jgi:uncharacterized protein YecT (DUF1311 family)
MRPYFLFLALALTPVNELRAQDSTCVNPSTTLAARECLSARLNDTDHAMGVLLDSLKTTLSDSAKVGLERATARWLEYRAAECHAVMQSYDGGSMGLIENLSCLIALTERRQQELRETYSSGDE